MPNNEIFEFFRVDFQMDKKYLGKCYLGNPDKKNKNLRMKSY
jgi:hypothetical protein